MQQKVVIVETQSVRANSTRWFGSARARTASKLQPSPMPPAGSAGRKAMAKMIPAGTSTKATSQRKLGDVMSNSDLRGNFMGGSVGIGKGEHTLVLFPVLF